MDKKCIKCRKKCEPDNYKVIAIERPYKTLFVHSECLEEIEKEYGEYPEGMALYLTKNTEIWYN